MRLNTPALILLSAVFALAALVSACGGGDDQEPPQPEPTQVEATSVSIQLTSTAFSEGGPIPTQYTCDGADKSPPLQWSGVPDGAKSIALIVDDPDAPGGTWVHWVLYGIPSDSTQLQEGFSTSGTTSIGAVNGGNDFKRSGYGGPCPPKGDPHRYFFKLYALDAEPDLEPGATKKDLLRSIEGKVLAEGQLMGTYQRP